MFSHCSSGPHLHIPGMKIKEQWRAHPHKSFSFRKILPCRLGMAASPKNLHLPLSIPNWKCHMTISQWKKIWEKDGRRSLVSQPIETVNQQTNILLMYLEMKSIRNRFSMGASLVISTNETGLDWRAVWFTKTIHDDRVNEMLLECIFPIYTTCITFLGKSKL